MKRLFRNLRTHNINTFVIFPKAVSVAEALVWSTFRARGTKVISTTDWSRGNFLPLGFESWFSDVEVAMKVDSHLVPTADYGPWRSWSTFLYHQRVVSVQNYSWRNNLWDPRFRQFLIPGCINFKKSLCPLARGGPEDSKTPPRCEVWMILGQVMAI